MNTLTKIAVGLLYGVVFIVMWLAFIFIALPCDFVHDVLIMRIGVKQAFGIYKHYWGYFTNELVESWESKLAE